jgi:S-(hydroxymethyl)glutathione dehydrogenase/alcohol dehydrogenase
MRAAVLHEGADRVRVEDVEVDRVGPHELLIATAAAGLCHSDLYHLRGVFEIPRPTVLGHESAGVVLEVGSEVDGFAPGDHVITCLTAPCGRCRRCQEGRSYLCPATHAPRPAGARPRLHRDGAEVHQFLNVSSFAEQLLVHETAAVRIRPDMPLDLAALLGCGVTTGLGAVFVKAQVRPGDTVAVIGCGGIGLSAVQGARIAGAARIIAVDREAAKRAAAIMLGATDFVAAGDDVAGTIRELTGGGVDHCIEAVGAPATATAAVEMLAVGGTATIVGLMPAGRTFPVQGRLLLDDRRIQGAYMGAEHFRVAMPRYVEMFMSGRLLLEEMVSSRIGLEGIDDAFASMEAGKALRDLVVFA